MKIKLLKCLLIGGLATGLIACDRGTIDSNLLTEDESGNNNIYRSYRVDYNEDTNQSMASATFSVGGAWGTTVKLIEPSSVKINGTTPRVNTDEFDGGEVGAFYAGFLFPPAWLLAGASGTTYHEAAPGNAGTVSFDFVDNSGSRFYESARIPSVYLSLPSSVSSSGFSVNVSGDTQVGRIYVRLSQDREYESVSGDGSTVNVSATDLADFAPGPIEVRVEVNMSERIEKDSESLGGRISTGYSFSTRTIQLR